MKKPESYRMDFKKKMAFFMCMNFGKLQWHHQKHF
jgi:hypothetical protein